jgi:hypothetical protein
MSLPLLQPPLRLGLLFFDAAEARAIRDMVNWTTAGRGLWIVVEDRPFHAVLMARGPRRTDPDQLALLRLSYDAERAARKAYGDAMPPMALRRPLQDTHLKIVLDVAAASLIPEYVESVSPQTQPRVSNTVTKPLTWSW